jgi:hypothetical protein
MGNANCLLAVMIYLYAVHSEHSREQFHSHTHESNPYATGPEQREPLASRIAYEPQNLARFLYREFHERTTGFGAEAKFEQRGFLPILEAAGILPPLINPNPYARLQEEDRYLDWWIEHPEAELAYQESLRHRREILNHIHIGSILGRIAGDQLFPDWYPLDNLIAQANEPDPLHPSDSPPEERPT